MRSCNLYDPLSGRFWHGLELLLISLIACCESLHIRSMIAKIDSCTGKMNPVGQIPVSLLTTMTSTSEAMNLPQIILYTKTGTAIFHHRFRSTGKREKCP
jgi:hypothetical protein